MCVGSLAGVTYLRYTALTSPKKGETAVRCCDPALSVHVILVSRNVFHVVSALQSILSSKKAFEYNSSFNTKGVAVDSITRDFEKKEFEMHQKENDIK